MKKTKVQVATIDYSMDAPRPSRRNVAGAAIGSLLSAFTDVNGPDRTSVAL